MNTVWEHNFRVRSKDTYNSQIVFGGKVMAEMDAACDTAVKRFLYDSPTGVHDAVTVAMSNLNFYFGAKVSDLVILRAEIVQARYKSIDIHVDGYFEQKSAARDLICEADFRFVGFDLAEETALPHGLPYETDYRPVFGPGRSGLREMKKKVK